MPDAPITTRKYQYWKLTGRGQLVGVLPLPEGHQPGYYVELDTDARGRVVALREWLEQYDQPLERKPTFDKGRLQTSEYNNPIHGRKGKNVYEYDKRGFLCRRRDEDLRGVVRFRFEVRCDGNGRIVEESLFTGAGRLKERRQYEHDAAGNEVKNILFGADGKTVAGFTTFAYDARGNITRRAWHDPAGRERQVVIYEYNEHDRRKAIHMESGGKRTTSQLNEYDPWGRIKSTRYVNAAGETISQLTPGQAGDTLVHKMLAGMPDEQLTRDERDVLHGRKDLADVLKVDAGAVDAMVTVAYSHLENGRFPQARALFEAVATLRPREVYALAGVGAAALGQMEHRTALAWYDRALAHDPKHIPSLVGRGEALVRIGEMGRAMENFSALFKLNPPANDPLVKRARLMVMAISQTAGAA